MFGMSVALMAEGFGITPCVAGFARLSSLSDLNLDSCSTQLVGTEETYAVLSQIPTLTKLDLSYSGIEALPEGEPCSPNASHY